jgi:hydrogenase maturation protease
MNDPEIQETVVIGVGNPLMGDDGLGIEVLERLRLGWVISPHLDLLDGGTWGLNLLPHVEGARRVMFIDAINIGREPGSLVELDGEEIPRFLAQKVSPHQIDVKEVLALAELRGTLPDELCAIGLQPENIEMRTSLTPAVASQIDRLLARIIERLRDWGYRVSADEVAPGA